MKHATVGIVYLSRNKTKLTVRSILNNVKTDMTRCYIVLNNMRPDHI